MARRIGRAGVFSRHLHRGSQQEQRSPVAQQGPARPEGTDLNPQGGILPSRSRDHCQQVGLDLFAEAAERFREAIAIHPDYGTSYANLASALQETGSWEKARVALERSLGINPFNPFVWKELGYVQMQAGEREGAVRSWKTALRLNPGDPDLRRMLGEHP